MWKLEFVVFLAGFALPITEKPRANVKDAKANIEWVLLAPSIIAQSREKA